MSESREPVTPFVLLFTGRTGSDAIDDLRDAVSDFDELRSHFQGTRYIQMFDEVLPTDRLP